MWEQETVRVRSRAGFIGTQTSTMPLKQGAHTIGIDNTNNIYDVSLKHYHCNMKRCIKIT